MDKRYPAVIMATACIPWDAGYSFMDDAFSRQVAHLLDNGIRHIYLFGTAGEGYAVGNRQFAEIVRRFADIMAGGDKRPMIGLIDMSAVRMKEKLEFAYGLGIREFQFSLPNWGALNDNEVPAFFDYLLKPYPDCTFLNYNLARTKRFLEPEELFGLAKRHPNFAAVKHTRGTESDLAAISGSDTPLRFFVTEKNFMELSRTAECGLLLSIGNVDLGLAKRFFSSCMNKNHAQAEKYLDVLWEIRDEMLKAVDFPAIDGAYDKMYCRYAVGDFPLRLLPPYQYVRDDMFEVFAEKTRRLLTETLME